MAEGDTPQDPGRRDALRKVLIGAGVVAAAPVVTTFNAPASAEIVSNTANRFQLGRGGAGTSLTAGPMTAVDPNAGDACVPAAWGGANVTVPADFDASGSATVTGHSGHVAPGLITVILGLSSQQFTVQMTLTLPAECSFASVADAQNRITARATKRVVDILPLVTVPSGPECDSTVNVANVANSGRTVDLSATFTEHFFGVGVAGIPAPLLGAYSNVARVELRIAPFCNP